MKNLSLVLVAVSMFLFSMIMLTSVTAGEWVQVQEGFTTIEVDEPPSGNWKVAQRATSDFYAGDIIVHEPLNIVELFIWLMILWMPALMLNYFVPGYGLIATMLVIGFIILTNFPSFLITYIIIITSGIAIFWRGVGS